MSFRRLLLVTLAALMAAVPGHAQNYFVMYNFGTNQGDPVQPQPGLIAQGRDGNLYGATGRGGADQAGTVFKITPSGELTVIYNFEFPFSSGAYPTGGLTLADDGYLYGATQSGGTSNLGTIFKISTAGDLTVLHSFTGSDGSTPLSPPIQGTSGNFYGGTSDGGSNGNGTIYSMTRAGQVTSIFSFDQSNGSGPLAALVQGTDGAFYGTTYGGGTSDQGTIFRITAEGEFTNWYMFDGTHGDAPSTQLVQGTDGSFYGTTDMGGSHNQGAIFNITTAGEISLLYSFSAVSERGYDPEGGLVLDGSGNLYGTAYMGADNNSGSIYRFSPQGQFQVLHEFNDAEGSDPFQTLLADTTGQLYGDTYAGGTHNLGVFYRINVGLEPFVKLLPNAGDIGKTIDIIGQGFEGTTGVSFNGTPASFKVVSDFFLTAIVPQGAATGYVTVTAPTGTLTSNSKFTVK
jgi:uncharacterized repeat protein (TIGR03803 family)